MGKRSNGLKRRKPVGAKPEPPSPLVRKKASITERVEAYLGERLRPTNATIRARLLKWPSLVDPAIFLRNVVYIALFVPLVGALIVAGVRLYNIRRWLRLRSGWYRPAMEVYEERQLLVYGLQGSGTTQMSRELWDLGLEMEHESSNSVMSFCRDGTVSWVHGLYAFQEGNDPPNTQLLCGATNPRFKVFHPVLFQGNCSQGEYWNACWRKECRELMAKNYGCMPRGRSCTTRFRRYLLQVRHPLRNIASNVAKYCTQTEWKSISSVPKLGLLDALRAFFPQVKWKSLKGCIHIFAKYWVEYNRRVLRYVDSWYQVENTTPCMVAKLGGFLDEGGPAYPESVKLARERCTEANMTVAKPSATGHINTINRGRLKRSYKDIQKLDPELYQELRTLAKTFGYLKNKEPE